LAGVVGGVLGGKYRKVIQEKVLFFSYFLGWIWVNGKTGTGK